MNQTVKWERKNNYRNGEKKRRATKISPSYSGLQRTADVLLLHTKDQSSNI